MSARAILQEMLGLLQAQTAHVIAGDHAALRDGAAHHEQLLARLETAPPDASPAELQELFGQIQREKARLQAAVSGELQRVDFLLRLYLEGAGPRASGYPGAAWSNAAGARLLNRRT